MRNTLLTLSLLSALSLAACGGGGSDPVPVAQVAVPDSTALALSATNYASAGKEALGAARFVEGTAAATSVVWEKVRTMSALFLTKLDSRTDPCALSGTVDIYIHDKNKDGLGSAGDDIVMVYNNCARLELVPTANGSSLAVTATYAGSQKLSLNEAIGGDIQSYPHQINVTVELGNFTRTLSSGTTTALAQTAKGILTIVSNMAAATSGTRTISTQAASGGFEATSGSLTRTFSDIATTTVFSTAGTQSKLSGALIVDGKSVSFQTTGDFFTPAGGDYPTQGTLVATGAAGATVTLQALDAATVGIQFVGSGQTLSTTSAWTAIN